MFVDASAIVAILAHEPERDALVMAISLAPRRISSAIARWESAHAIARIRNAPLSQSSDMIDELLDEAGITLVNITAEIGDAAVAASARYGRGRHRASLNMGDCFAYACAQVHGVPILYKGDDFGQTDARPAWPSG